MESSDRRFEEHERCKVTWPYGRHARLFPIVSGGEEFFIFLLLLFFFIFIFCFFTTLQVFLCTELNINAWSFCNTFLSQPLYWTGVTRNYKEYIAFPYFPFELSRVISYGPLSFRSLAIVAIKPLFQVPREKPLVPRVVLSRSQV